MPAQLLTPYAKEGRLAPLDLRSELETFYFKFSVERDGVTNLAPHALRRSYAANYAPVQVALSTQIPEEWRSNQPVVIPIEFEVVSAKQQSIDAELRKLRKFMKKDRRTGEPTDLLFVMGAKQWVVRIHLMDVTPAYWNQGVDEVRAKVALTLHTTQPED